MAPLSISARLARPSFAFSSESVITPWLIRVEEPGQKLFHRDEKCLLASFSERGMIERRRVIPGIDSREKNKFGGDADTERWKFEDAVCLAYQSTEFGYHGGLLSRIPFLFAFASIFPEFPLSGYSRLLTQAESYPGEK